MLRRVNKILFLLKARTVAGPMSGRFQARCILHDTLLNEEKISK